MEMSKKERIKRSFLIVLIMVVAIVSIISSRERRARKKQEKEKEQIVEMVGNYNIDIIKTTSAQSNNSNYLISPYNIELALNMLREGALGNTKEEIDKVIGNRTINDVSIKNKLSIANGLFIKNAYKEFIKKDFTDNLEDNYQAEVLYDDFKTPTVINKWVNNKTKGMIDKILDNIDPNFVMGLASALALDVKWQNEFKCSNTLKEDFIKEDKSKMNVEMMHQTYERNAKYFKTDDVEGIILPYRKEDNSNIELEFVGILPKNSVNNYINNLTTDKINDIFNNTKTASEKVHVHVSIPRFTYSYSVNNLKNVLNTLGIKDAFDKEKANFKNIMDDDIYVSTAIHKTRIELNEVGTKAAAVTYFGLEAAGMIPEQDWEDVYIKLNKPFAYMIREKNTGEILFFGSVYEPNTWNGSTCSDN